MIQAFLNPFYRIRYVVIAVAVAVFVLAAVILLPHVSLLAKLAGDSSIETGEIISIAFSLLGSLKTNFTFLSATYTIFIAVFFGINTTLLVYYIRERAVFGAGNGTVGSVAGLLFGTIGTGCAACGSVILSSLFALFGAGGTLALLPFRGQEFGIIGVLLLLFSTYMIVKKIAVPPVCVPSEAEEVN